jgi:hypothetical protein
VLTGAVLGVAGITGEDVVVELGTGASVVDESSEPQENNNVERERANIYCCFIVSFLIECKLDNLNY